MTMTYTECPMCSGTLRIELRSKDGEKIRFNDCPCRASSRPGWAPNGLTIRQIDRMVERERILAGDPGIPPDRRARVLADIRNKLDMAFRGIPAEESSP